MTVELLINVSTIYDIFATDTQSYEIRLQKNMRFTQ